MTGKPSCKERNWQGAVEKIPEGFRTIKTGAFPKLCYTGMLRGESAGSSQPHGESEIPYLRFLNHDMVSGAHESYENQQRGITLLH